MPSTFEKVSKAIAGGSVRVSQHAIEELGLDDLEIDSVLEATLRGEVIEDYPTDPRGPSCLVLSVPRPGLWVHTVWGFDEASGLAVLITAYRPRPEKWHDDFKTRRRSSG